MTPVMSELLAGEHHSGSGTKRRAARLDGAGARLAAPEHVDARAADDALVLVDDGPVEADEAGVLADVGDARRTRPSDADRVAEADGALERRVAQTRRSATTRSGSNGTSPAA